MSGTLYLVSTPIGNPDDLTFRARHILETADGIICEERREGAKLLARLGLRSPLFELNEHTPTKETAELLERLLGGENLALISDHGTPLIEDPGAGLVKAAIEKGIRVEPIPGASAIIAALVASGLPCKRFRFVGQLSPKTQARRRQLERLEPHRETLVLLDAPYRLMALLRALREVFGDERRIAVACNLTMPDENWVRGTIRQAVEYFQTTPFKGEYVIVIEGKDAARRSPLHSQSKLHNLTREPNS